MEDFFTYYYTRQLLSRKKNHKFSSLVFIARPDAKCTNVKNHFHISDLVTYYTYGATYLYC